MDRAGSHASAVTRIVAIPFQSRGEHGWLRTVAKEVSPCDRAWFDSWDNPSMLRWWNSASSGWEGSSSRRTAVVDAAEQRRLLQFHIQVVRLAARVMRTPEHTTHTGRKASIFTRARFFPCIGELKDISTSIVTSYHHPIKYPRRWDLRILWLVYPFLHRNILSRAGTGPARHGLFSLLLSRNRSRPSRWLHGTNPR